MVNSGPAKKTFWLSCMHHLAVFSETAFSKYILFPFLVTRGALLLAGWFARDTFQPNPTYADYAQRGYFLTRFFFIDMFTHWDGKWYLSIARQGYQFSSDLTTQYSNVAFYPLYPYLVRALAWLSPVGRGSETLLLAVGLLVSNLCFLLAAWLIFRLGREYLSDEMGAARAVGLLVVFPASFFFSSFYPEALFLLLSVAAFWFALKQHWLLAALMGALAAVTRLQGIALAVPLVWLYMDSSAGACGQCVQAYCGWRCCRWACWRTSTRCT